ncbi:dipeptide/oligopeptide/nickel ABC transporter ATP-binding protein [Mycolicibacterium agri]|uniref:ABC transporter ATP-binding protein n=1 Tax=Mycolicibacterium agri TaxID=36811 RepID=A0A2A7N9G6_MYCAG|nr:ABC transporter ATP-binding protein [Mycolicibacterium agri]PEG40685.1 dipeptide/oligopeptide/nickel ABC transporter ATP-binding protein [Mycolicibacterium agri]GFG49366.1 ABC transporter ATP-binding protein [Mycolicibacterium agri]
MNDTVVEVANLVKVFGTGRHASKVLDDVGFSVQRGETVGLVGESGSGKSTTARCILRLIEPTSGTIRFEGEDVLSFRRAKLKEYRARAQLVFQDPYSSLDPRMCVEDIIGEGIRIHRPRQKRSAIRDQIVELLELVGLRPDHLPRRPAAFSGGERQRIGIARALAVQPSLLICDEPVASLDVSIQAQILNLFVNLKSRLGLTMIYIAHDLATVRHLCDRIVVMQGGQVKEIGSRDEIYGSPRDPYTIALMRAVPEPDPVVARERSRERRLASTAEGIAR